MNPLLPDSALAPCRHCGAPGTVLHFAANRAIPEPFDIWTCSAATATGGQCHDGGGYFTAEDWNRSNRP